MSKVRTSKWRRRLFVVVALVVAIMVGNWAQMLGAEWVNRRFGAGYQSVLERSQREGAIAIFAVTAHPIGLLTPAHLAGGLVGMSATQFSVAITLAAPLRAVPYAFLGTAMLDMSAMRAGLELAELDAAIEGRDQLAELEDNQRARVAVGHWGVPTMVVTEEPFFGQDRVKTLRWRLDQYGLARAD